MFGQTQQATSLFGATPPSTGAFGTPAKGPSLFGQAPQQQAATGTGLFGQPKPPATPAGGSLFGAPQATTQAPPSTTTSLFGQAAQPQQQTTAFGAPSGGGTNLFGQPAQPKATTGTGLFGAPPTAGGSLFGQPKAAPVGSLFGQQPKVAGTGSLFGQQAGQPKVAGSLFGAPAAPAVPQPTQQQQQPTQVADLIVQMAQYWNTSSPHCQFKHYFFNMVHPSDVQYYQPPPTEDPMLYGLAQKNNPDPTCMVPVLATGFEDLKKRSDMQAAQVAVHQAKLTELQAHLATLSRAHSLENVIKTAEVTRRQVVLEQKVFTLMKHVHLLRNKGYPVREEEEALRAKLTRVQQELMKPGLLKARIQELQLLLSRARLGGERQGQLEMSEEEEGKLLAILQAHKAALSSLTDRAYKDVAECKEVKRGFQEVRAPYY